jgi:hypothetical protein
MAEHSLNVRDKPGFLRRMMVELAGNAQMSVEGDLSRCRFNDDLIVTSAETAILKRNTTAPKQDFAVLRLRLTPETVGPIFKQVMAAGLKRAIVHVQIERNGVLELGAYDNFHHECVVTGPSVSPELLTELKNTKVLRDFKVAARKRRQG